jgi:hypothetical protein
MLGNGPEERLYNCPLDSFKLKPVKNNESKTSYECPGCGLSIPEDVIEDDKKVQKIVQHYRENVVLA